MGLHFRYQSFNGRRNNGRRNNGLPLLTLLLAAVFVGHPADIRGEIAGGVGNKPIDNQDWPQGAAVIFNHKNRIGWWEGPPFGGGQWHSECRGNAKAFNDVLKHYAKLDVKTKRLTIHEGRGASFWLNPNGEPDKKVNALMDWSFTVWDPKAWERLRKLPPDLNPTLGDGDSGPAAQLDVYVGGGIRWKDVDEIPAGIQVDDRRLAAHGFTIKDGIVLQGKIADLASEKPIAGNVELQRVEPQKKGGYLYPVVRESKSDDAGNWVLKNVPPGWYRIVVLAEGFVPRVLGYDRFDEEPRWLEFNGNLAPAAAVSGTIVDEEGQPLKAVLVRLADVVSVAGGRYQAAKDYRATTDDEGRFRLEPVPVGEARIRLSKSGYFRPGLGQQVSMPSGGLKLSMNKSAELIVTVKFKDKAKPNQYIVEIEPEGGSAVGKYGGSGRINEDDQMVFKNVPPGRYIIEGHPNPTSNAQRTSPVIVQLKGGETTELDLSAK